LGSKNRIVYFAKILFFIASENCNQKVSFRISFTICDQKSIENNYVIILAIIFEPQKIRFLTHFLTTQFFARFQRPAEGEAIIPIAVERKSKPSVKPETRAFSHRSRTVRIHEPQAAELSSGGTAKPCCAV